MFPFFRKKQTELDQLKNEGRESAVQSSEITGTDAGESSREVETELSLHPAFQISKEQMYVLRFLNNELPPLKANQLALAGIEWEQHPQGLAVSAFVRNSVSKEVKIGKVSLLVINEKDQMKARHNFDLSELGELPAKSSRPWTFVFPFSSIEKHVELSKENWTIAFDLTTREHRLDLADSWQEALPEREKEKLEQVVKQLGSPGKDELNFTGLQAQISENGSLHVTLLIRNGYNRNINIEKLPLQVLDNKKEVVAEGQFNVGSLEVKANASKPWSFIFQKELLRKPAPDFSTWSVRVKRD
ncbi:accessory Sec system S-layer assembly protein [Bacillus thermotolerans]|uniref:Glutamate synthase [NADPH] large chain n=1 Tax=Bacillus thermotolerans TaxID=1221996 RepID=A0A0F5I6W1_BACTR|nr:accessory Sec system S-layer assembly protein [Bacillus thermotolerans]KKB41178.1 Glutamate synthase [NADPH] large chain [Bacillus thermotolerans]